MLESKQVRHFSRWDLLSLEYIMQTQVSPLGFSIGVFSILNPVDPLDSVYLNSMYDVDCKQFIIFKSGVFLLSVRVCQRWK